MCDQDYNPNICLSLVSDLLPSAADAPPAEHSDEGDVTAAEANVNGDGPPAESRREGLSIPPPRSECSPKGSRRSEASMRSGTPQEEKKTWYIGMYPSYKSRGKEFKELFNCGESRFIVDFSCAYNKDILHQGRMYLSTQYCCFYSNIFGWENNIKIDWKDVSAITKERIAIVIPNAIQIRTNDGDFFFATFANRDATFAIMYRLWQGIVNNQPMGEEEVCQIIMCQYPEEETAEGSVTQEQGSEPVKILPVTTQESNLLELSDNVKGIVTSWLETTPGSPVLDTIIQKPLDQVFSLLYSNSDFYFTFQKDRGTTELDIGEWEQTESQSSSREVTYNMKMNNSVGPKTCQVKELQLLRQESLPTQLYCIDTEAFNSGVPYADSFTVRTHLLLYRETHQSCRLVAYAEIVFRKELWGFLKEKIETNAWKGIRGYYQDLGVSIQSHSEDQVRVAEPLKTRLNTVKRSREAPPTTSYMPDVKSPVGREIFLSFVIGLLCVTCAVNVVVLFSLQGYTPAPGPSPPLPSFPQHLVDKLPDTDQEWIQLLRRQAAKHHKTAQDVSESLTKVSIALGEAEKILRKVGELLRTDQEQKEFRSVLQNLNTGAESLDKLEL